MFAVFIVFAPSYWDEFLLCVNLYGSNLDYDADIKSMKNKTNKNIINISTIVKWENGGNDKCI